MSSRTSAPAEEAVDESVESVAGTEPIGVPSLIGAVREVGAVFAQAGALSRSGRKLAGELAQIARGETPMTFDRKDWRFTDPAWTDNPIFRRVGQSYLAGCSFVDGLLDEFETKDRDTVSARFLLSVLTTAAAPTNSLIGNPPALKRALETHGASLVRGAKNFVGDIQHNGGLPSTVDRTALQVGRDLALTPGSVIQRDEYAELLQYQPTTETVSERPVLVIPPPIGRYYFLDLAPGRSFLEHSVGQGQQTFVMSWRNPGKKQAGWSLDDYSRRVLSAIDAVCEVTGSPDVNLVGFCAGGLLMTLVLNHLAAESDDRVHSATYAVTLLDFGGDAPITAFSAPKLLKFARWNSGRQGVIGARSMGAVFAFMRPNDLVWNYWVNNYLMGNPPPVFDILAWNADGTNLPATLHREFLDIFQNNTLCEPGAVVALGTPVDLSRIKVPIYVTGALSDHLTPWTECYRTTQLLSGPATFILSNAGHIQSLINPPNNPKASFVSGPEPVADPLEWREKATLQKGTWWTHWTTWITDHAGKKVAAPTKLGSAEHPPLQPAPGRYVRQGA
jgi:polyhydroxyalkanoate synthase